MDFNKARTFIEVVDRGGITAAASRLKRTQQAISAQISNLEDDLGIPLLVRQGPNITLTADGERLYRLFKEHLVTIEGAVQDLKTDKTRASGVIRIGAWLEGTVYYLPEVIKEFSEKYPLVDFEIYTDTDEALEAMLTANKIDISFQIHTKNQRLLKKTPVFSEKMIPVVSRTYVNKHGMPKTLEATLDMPVIDFHALYSTYIYWIKKNHEDLFLAAQKKTMFVRVSNNITLKQLVLKGLGVGMLVESMIQEELDSGELIALLFAKKTEPIWVEFDIVYKRHNSLSFITKEFIRHALEYRERNKMLMA